MCILKLKRALCAFLAASVCMGLTIPVSAKTGYNDFDAITSHVNLKVPTQLTVTRPESAALTTSDSTYFITGGGSGDALTLNGEAVMARGTRGSFGVLVELVNGNNDFTFKQGGQTKAITITRTAAGAAYTIKNIRNMVPSYDCATTSGSPITLSCTAPSGASVTATVGGRTVQLQQVAAATAGVAATFTAKTTAGEVKGTKNLGVVTYTLNGATSYQSAGSVFVTGSGSALVVQVKNNAASIYKDAARSAFIETAHQGGLDSVAEIGGDTYRLSSGGWIPKDSVQPLTQAVTLRNTVKSTTLKQQDGGEYYTFGGTSYPMYRANQTAEGLSISFFNTTISADRLGQLEAMSGESALFSNISATLDGTTLTIVYTLSGKRVLWGYDIQYTDGGGMYVFAKYAPKANGSLKGMTIAVDAGHGGSDPGAIGISGTGGAMEKDINLATAIAVKKRLESLGATVLMCRTGDDDVTMNTRMDDTRKVYADLFISLHCNSVGYGKNSFSAVGSEVYYFEGIAAKFSSTLSANLSAYTGRKNRGAKFSNFRVTLNTFAPSVLVEMGFLTNPTEYDDMTSRQGVFNTANAVGDSVLALMA